MLVETAAGANVDAGAFAGLDAVEFIDNQSEWIEWVNVTESSVNKSALGSRNGAMDLLGLSIGLKSSV
jgi:hypothetical protein